MTPLFKVLIFAVLSLVLAFLAVRHIEGRSVFFPMRGEPFVPPDAPPHEEIYFETSDRVKLHGWLVPSASGIEAPVMLFLHGNAGNIGHRWEKIRILRHLGFSVFIFDYRGFGRSEGRPSEAGIYKDVDAAAAFLAGRGIPTERILVYGESIGGAFAVDLAARKEVRALIVEDTFTSLPAMVARTMPLIPSFFLGTRLDSLSKIGRVLEPKLVIHSVDDEIVPIEMGEALFAAAAEPKRFVKLRGGHNTAFIDDLGAYRGGLSEFAASL